MLFGRREKFFTSLHAQIDLLAEASRLLLEGAQQGRSGTQVAAGIDRLGEQVLDLDVEMARELSRTLITPIDPEDILRLSSLMKRLLGSLAGAASRQEFCPRQPAPAELVKE